MQDDPPVAEFVAEALHQQCGVGGHHTGGLPLVIEQLPQVVRGEVVETHCAATFGELIAAQARELTGERTDGRAEFGGPTHAVAAPERQPGGLSRCGHDQDPVVGDLGDPPARRAQRDHVSWPRLVNHLLVEFTYPRGLFGISGQIDGEQAAVGDRAAGCHRQPLRAGAGGQRARVAVVHQPRAQLGELGGRVLAGKQVQRCLERAAWQRRKRGAAPDRVEPAVGIQWLEGTRRDGVLCQHIERIRRHPHGLDLTGQHPFDGDRAPDEIRSVLGKQHTLGDLADLVTRTADALQPLATDGGASTWITRSTAPMSMPNSRLDVATTAFSRPDFRSSSTCARCSLLTEPWCARASSVGAPNDAPLAISCAGKPPPTFGLCSMDNSTPVRSA